MALPVIGRIRSNAVIAEDIDAAFQEIASICNGGLDASNLARGLTLSTSYFQESYSLIHLTGIWNAGETYCVLTGIPSTYNSRLWPVRLQAIIYNTVATVPTVPTAPIYFKFRDATYPFVADTTIGTVNADRARLKAVPDGETAFIGVNEQPGSGFVVANGGVIYATSASLPSERSFVSIVLARSHL